MKVIVKKFAAKQDQDNANIKLSDIKLAAEEDSVFEEIDFVSQGALDVVALDDIKKNDLTAYLLNYPKLKRVISYLTANSISESDIFIVNYDTKGLADDVKIKDLGFIDNKTLGSMKKTMGVLVRANIINIFNHNFYDYVYIDINYLPRDPVEGGVSYVSLHSSEFHKSKVVLPKD